MLAYEQKIAEHDVQKRKASGGDQSTLYLISEAVSGLSYNPMMLWDGHNRIVDLFLCVDLSA